MAEHVSWTRPRWRGLDVELTPQQELACALRILARRGCNLDVAGHITVVAADGSGDLWCSPWGLWWEEVTASDVLRLDADGNVLEGRYDVTPAVALHTALHRARHDAVVAVHNHPHYGILLGTMEIEPVVTEQQGSLLHGEIGLDVAYDGAVLDGPAGDRFVAGLGGRSAVLLRQHGAMVLGPDLPVATYKAVSFERTCRLTYETLAVGREPVPLDDAQQLALKSGLTTYSATVFWEGAVRQLLAAEPEVLG